MARREEPTYRRSESSRRGPGSGPPGPGGGPGSFGFRRGDGQPREPGGAPDRGPWRPRGPHRDRPPFERRERPPFDHRDRPKFERRDRPPFEQRDRPPFERRERLDRPPFDRPDRPFQRRGPDRSSDRRPPGPPSGGRPLRPGGRFDRPRPAPSGAWRPQAGAPTLGPDEELVAGRRPVQEAFAAGRAAIRLLVVPQRREALERLVLHATTLRIPIVEVEGGSLTSLAGFDGHQGIALVVGPRRFATVDEMLARAIERAEPAFLLVLDSLEDPQNVGSLLRSAEAAGVHGVIFPTRRQAPLSPSAVKASGGATEHLLLAAVDDLAGTLADLHGRGVRILGAEAEAALTARQSDLRGPIALVVGSEGQGLGPSVRRRCDAFLRITMRGKVGSLNAAVAGSILLFEAVEQRLEAPRAADSAHTAAPPPKARSRSRAMKAPEAGGSQRADAEAPPPGASSMPPLEPDGGLLQETPPKRPRGARAAKA